ncbi:MAG TPA: hypothetical protein VFO34_05925 [Candidatus Acidoferrales bacterium]|nr:hypothetical protein [Candidatus Acidoferrales bacterium]
MKRIVALAACLSIPLLAANAQQPSSPQSQQSGSMADCPMHAEHMKNAAPSAAMQDRGDKGMGFSQTATTHHFLLKPDGGVIQVEFNDSKDGTNLANIRTHLAHIADAFAQGDFDIPMFVHDTVPPGVPEMKQLRASIKYLFEETPNGGRVVIRSENADALAAIHKFLRFQIEEHKTGDPLEMHP